MSPREKVMERIRKLMAHAESANKIGNEAEAEAFASKVQELLVAHKLEMSTISTTEDNDEMDVIAMESFKQDVKRGTRVGWEELLASAVAYGHGCRILLGWRGSIKVVGPKVNRQLAIYTYEVLHRTTLRLARKAYGEARARGMDTRGFYKSFHTGFAQTIRARYVAEERKAAELHKTKNVPMVINNDRNRTNEWMANQHFGKSKASNTNITNLAGYQTGRKAGEGVGIRSNGIEGGYTGPKRLGS